MIARASCERWPPIHTTRAAFLAFTASMSGWPIWSISSRNSSLGQRSCVQAAFDSLLHSFCFLHSIKHSFSILIDRPYSSCVFYRPSLLIKNTNVCALVFKTYGKANKHILVGITTPCVFIHINCSTLFKRESLVVVDEKRNMKTTFIFILVYGLTTNAQVSH